MAERRWWIAGSAAVLVAIGIMAVGAAAGANGFGPSQQTDQGNFIAESEVDAAWAQATAAIEQPLPDGVTFPDLAPAFFHRTDTDEPQYYHEAIPALIAARYWRCAWLAVEIDASSPADKHAAQAAVDAYRDLPEVAEYVDVPDYDAEMASYAESIDQDPASAEFDIECEFYSDNEGDTE